MVHTLRYGYFEIDPLLAVARHTGMLAAKQIEVDATRVSSSDEQFADLASGRYDVIQTAFDNVANYALNHSNSLARTLNVAAVVPIDRGMGLSLTGRPGIQSISQLRGLTVSVDSPRSGFAFVVYALLRKNGIDETADCDVVSHGGAAQRLEKLLSGEADATLLTQQLSDRAVSQGCRVLATLEDACDPYLSSVVAAPTSFLAGPLSALLDVYRTARAYVFDPVNWASVVDALAAARGIDHDAATKVVAAAMSDGGLVREDDFDPVAVRNTLELRRSFDAFDEPVDIDALSGSESPLLLSSERRSPTSN